MKGEKEEKKEYGYVQFPLCLLQETFRNRENAINTMLDYGIVKYAMTFDYTKTDVVRQLLYDYTRNPDKLQRLLWRELNNNEDTYLTEDEFLYSADGKFEPDEEATNYMLKLFAKDKDIEAEAILNYQIHVATSPQCLNVGITKNDNTIKRYNNGKSLQAAFESRFRADAMPMCNKSLLFDFRDNLQNDINLLRAYIGIKSLIGRNNFATTHKSVILSRMLGCKSNEALTAFLSENDDAKETYDKYSGRKRMDKLLFQLMERKLVTVLSRRHESRIYVSTKLRTPMELATAISQKREEKNLIQQIEEARRML
jgi:hypothetical protein